MAKQRPSVLGWLALAFLLVLLVAPTMPMGTPLHTVVGMAPPVVWAVPLMLVALSLFVRVSKKKVAPGYGWLGALLLLGSGAVLGVEIPQRATGGEGLKVMTYNVHFDSTEMPDLLAYIKEEKVDVVFVQENKGRPVQYLSDGLPDWHVFQDESVAILSRYPIVRKESETLRTFPTRRILSAVVDVDGKEMRLITTHLTAPQMTQPPDQLKKAGQAKAKELNQLMAVMRKSKLPTVLGGDFNDTPAHGLTRTLSSNFENCFGACGVGPGWTYPSGAPVLRIDHLYAANGVTTQQAWVAPHLGSDHRPLVAVVSLP